MRVSRRCCVRVYTRVRCMRACATWRLLPRRRPDGDKVYCMSTRYGTSRVRPNGHALYTRGRPCRTARSAKKASCAARRLTEKKPLPPRQPAVRAGATTTKHTSPSHHLVCLAPGAGGPPQSGSFWAVGWAFATGGCDAVIAADAGVSCAAPTAGPPPACLELCFPRPEYSTSGKLVHLSYTRNCARCSGACTAPSGTRIEHAERAVTSRRLAASSPAIAVG